MSISAMKQALDAITNVLAGNDFDNPYADLKQAGAALRQAIEQAEDAVLAEREACAQVCEDLIGTRAMARHCADAIRARGEK